MKDRRHLLETTRIQKDCLEISENIQPSVVIPSTPCIPHRNQHQQLKTTIQALTDSNKYFFITSKRDFC